MTTLALIVDIRLAPGAREAFLERVRAHARACLALEPGCLRFDVLSPDGEADRVVLYEVYADQAALDAHRATDRIATFFDDTRDMIAERSRVLCRVVPE